MAWPMLAPATGLVVGWRHRCGGLRLSGGRPRARGRAWPDRLWPPAFRPDRVERAAQSAGVSSTCKAVSRATSLPQLPPEIQRHHQRPGRAVHRLPIAARRPLLHGGRCPSTWNSGDKACGGWRRMRSPRRCRLARRCALLSVAPASCAPGGLVNTQGAQGAVGVQRGRTEHFREGAAHDAAVELQLPAPLLGMHIAHGHPGVAGIAGQDVGHIARIPLHLDGTPQARDAAASPSTTAWLR